MSNVDEQPQVTTTETEQVAMPNPPVRKRAAVKKTAAPKKRVAPRVRLEPIVVPVVEERKLVPAALVERLNLRDSKLIGASIGGTLAFVLLISTLTGFNFSFRGSSNAGTTATYASKAQSGTQVLTESQLRAEVRKISTPVYWVGPAAGSKYTLENQNGQRIFVRYLPDGKIPPAGEASKRIVGTYKLANAFTSTEAAGTSIAGGIGFTNNDGAAVYYNKTSPNNVYVAFPNVDAQIEIFDPVQGIAVQLASTKGALQVIK